MQWEKLSVPIKVEVDVYNIVVNRVREQVIGAKGFLTDNLIQASRYCFNKNINLEEAVGWARRVVTGWPFGLRQYVGLSNLAMGYEKLNRLSQADSVMNEAVKLASANQFTAYGRQLLAQKRKDRGMEIMVAAQAKFGDVFAVNNGLAYAYSAKGDYTKALEFANKALQQAPAPQMKAAINANVEKLKAGKDINQ
ncbi:tetratricopeptide repeat protein [Paraflavitalea speifideaquila]|uniref:tetratricopeptide repeat protein n=1 Tax=Paraflavitalea speifideaquila TaxID=3076558 RepID=UPI0028EE80ED|nr:tetratricopeptide repeat protein [Paraflavitalea speifideiaquila]